MPLCLFLPFHPRIPSPLFVLMHGWPLVEKTFSQFNFMSLSLFKWPGEPYENTTFMPSKGHFSLCVQAGAIAGFIQCGFRISELPEVRSCLECASPFSHLEGTHPPLWVKLSSIFSRCHRYTLIHIQLTAHHRCEPKNDRKIFKNASDGVSYPRKKKSSIAEFFEGNFQSHSAIINLLPFYETWPSDRDA